MKNNTGLYLRGFSHLLLFQINQIISFKWEEKQVEIVGLFQHTVEQANQWKTVKNAEETIKFSVSVDKWRKTGELLITVFKKLLILYMSEF